MGDSWCCCLWNVGQELHKWRTRREKEELFNEVLYNAHLFPEKKMKNSKRDWIYIRVVSLWEKWLIWLLLLIECALVEKCWEIGSFFGNKKKLKTKTSFLALFTGKYPFFTFISGENWGGESRTKINTRERRAKLEHLFRILPRTLCFPSQLFSFFFLACCTYVYGETNGQEKKGVGRGGGGLKLISLISSGIWKGGKGGEREKAKQKSWVENEGNGGYFRLSVSPTLFFWNAIQAISYSKRGTKCV